MADRTASSVKKAFLANVCLYTIAHGAVIFKGDADPATNQTFTFAIGPVSFVAEPTGGHQLAPRGAVISAITGADAIKANNQWAVSLYMPGLAQFVPMAPAQVTLDDQANQANPLYGQKIKFVSASTASVSRLDDLLFFTVADQAAVKIERFTAIYNSEIKDASKPTEVSVSQVQSNVPLDSNGDAADHIIGMAFAAPNAPVILAPVKNSAHFGAPAPTGTSGIAGALYTLDKTASAIRHSLPLINLDPRYADDIRRAVLFDTSLAALSVSPNEYDDHGILRINAPADMANIIDTRATPLDMWWDGQLSRLYMAVQITPGAGASTGARAIVIGRFSAGKLYYEKIIPNTAFANPAHPNLIVGTRAGQLDVYHVRTMHTSTGLPYLIVHGGIGASSPGKVYALPIAQPTTGADADHLYGSIADCTQNPTDVYSNDRFIGRLFATPATTANTIYDEADPAVLVGGQMLTYTSQVGSIFVGGDSVYMTVEQDYDGAQHAPGIFQSQAIFDSTGKIIGWSTWRRVGGSDDQTVTAAVDQAAGSFWWLTGAGKNVMKHSVWSTGSGDGLLGGPQASPNQGFLSLLSTALPKNKGGIQALANFDLYDSSMAPYLATLVGGLNTVAVALTGYEAIDGVVHPIFGNFATDMGTSTDGSFPAHTANTRMFIISGGALENLGPINSVSIVREGGGEAYILAGGTNGIAILCNATGHGFNNAIPSTDFTFKSLGNLGYTRKIWGDDTYIYILTDKSLLRAPIDPADFVAGRLETVKLLSAQEHASFSDIVGLGRVVVAGSTGLLYNAGALLAHAADEAALRWTSFALPESLGAETSLQLTNQSSGDFGQLFALSAYQGYDLARAYRLVFDIRSATPVSFIGDQFLKNHPSYFVSYPNFRNYWTSNGSIALTTRPLFVDIYDTARPAQLSNLPPSLTPGTLGFPARESVSLLPTIPGMSILGRPTAMLASGAWLVAGDYLHVCE